MIPFKPRTVFIIEDNRTENILLKLSLNTFENLTIKSFINGKDLLNNLNISPDIVIIDLNLPDIHGLELIKLINEFNTGIYIIVVSAQKDIEMIAKVQEEGVFNYLVKSEGCLKYLRNVVEDAMILLDYRENLEKTED